MPQIEMSNFIVLPRPDIGVPALAVCYVRPITIVVGEVRPFNHVWSDVCFADKIFLEALIKSIYCRLSTSITARVIARELDSNNILP